MLGANIQCDQLIILTAIDYVYINFNTENQQPLKTTNVDELKRYIDENQFAKGSMLPKIEAAISFKGVIVAVGTGRLLNDGTRVTPEVKEGDRVVFQQYAGTEVKRDNETYLVLNEEDILAVIE